MAEVGRAFIALGVPAGRGRLRQTSHTLPAACKAVNATGSGRKPGRDNAKQSQSCRRHPARDPKAGRLRHEGGRACETKPIMGGAWDCGFQTRPTSRIVDCGLESGKAMRRAVSDERAKQSQFGLPDGLGADGRPEETKRMILRNKANLHGWPLSMGGRSCKTKPISVCWAWFAGLGERV